MSTEPTAPSIVQAPAIPGQIKKSPKKARTTRAVNIAMGELIEGSGEGERDSYVLVYTDSNFKEQRKPCSATVYAAAPRLSRMSSHIFDLYRDENEVIVAVDPIEKNEFGNSVPSDREDPKHIIVSIDPVTGYSSVRVKPFKLDVAEVTLIKRWIDEASVIEPLMLLGNRYMVIETRNTATGPQIVIDPTPRS